MFCEEMLKVDVSKSNIMPLTHEEFRFVITGDENDKQKQKNFCEVQKKKASQAIESRKKNIDLSLKTQKGKLNDPKTKDAAQKEIDKLNEELSILNDNERQITQ